MSRSVANRLTGITTGLALLLSCSESRDFPESPTVFTEVAPILQTGCLECHGGDSPAANYRVEDYFTSIYCIPDAEGLPAAMPPDQTAPILAVLERADHQSLIDDPQEQTLQDWVVTGALPRRRGSHPAGFGDPFSGDWHGAYLRNQQWLPLTDPERSDACGLCHEGSVTNVPGVEFPAPGATPCTTCHDEPDGVMACGTCHGDGERPYPPRDQCFFRGPPFGGLHGVHATSSANAPRPLGCQSCHFGEDYRMLTGGHANGEVNVTFQPAWGESASYDFDTQTCNTTCHARGGTTPVVAWDQDLEIDCASCHENPPAGHSTIACNSCHRGIDVEGMQLGPSAPHLNGRVDAFVR